MRKTIKKCQNRAKALELKLEEESTTKYELILAGMTINLRQGCISGVCEGSREDDYLFLENETFRMDHYNTLADATHAFDLMKLQYID